jgi:hypothetical protein
LSPFLSFWPSLVICGTISGFPPEPSTTKTISCGFSWRKIDFSLSPPPYRLLPLGFSFLFVCTWRWTR